MKKGTNLETKGSRTSGSQGGGKALPVQIGKAGQDHGRTHKAVHPDRHHKFVKKG